MPAAQRPQEEPVGLFVTRSSRALAKAFDGVLGEVGGSLPVWLVVLSLKTGGHGTQSEIAKAVGIEGATLTHHLTRMESAGLVTRTRDPANRRAQLVELTAEGDALFAVLLERVVAFDEQLRAGFSDRELGTLRRLLGRLVGNATATGDQEPAGAKGQRR